MDRELIEQKLESLRRCHQRIEEKTPADMAALLDDPDLQDILTLNLTRAVQLCVDIGSHLIADRDVEAPASMGATFDCLAAEGIIPDTVAAQLRKAVGFRNIAVHNYEAINWDIVYAISRDYLEDFRAFAGAISALLDH